MPKQQEINTNSIGTVKTRILQGLETSETCLLQNERGSNHSNNR